MIEGLAAVDKSINTNDYLHGVLRDDEKTLLACLTAGFGGARRPWRVRFNKARTPSRPRRRRPTGCGDRLTSYALPQQPTKIPLLAIYGGSDPRPFLRNGPRSPWAGPVHRGDTILRIRMGRSKGTNWIRARCWASGSADRFAGVPAVGNC